ncbi:MAG: Holliday junction ATP-dependent DNA helicase RuvB [Chlamydiia bacterium]|nr:Holliday junction ATP-dependent DNA helicase RuvB [Chlamydiia bacterium]
MQSKEYIALSRKYRPNTFDDIIGHKEIITILKNQLESKKLAHAYLFTGLHGTGKTTFARIFAKALNCDCPSKDLNPCNECPSCKEISASSSLDVLEIDGASNRGIDDIRNINETVGYATFQGKYKVYIIDEVHMLTKEAFNALLKTLEEPPENTKFFLATTEAHKIPATILSRCQRIDLRRIELSLIKDKLKGISEDLKTEISDDALSLIARIAEGSMRDAESLLENVIAYSNKISADDIYQILGLCPKNLFFEIDDAFAKQDFSIIFKIAPKLFSTHTNLNSLIDELSIHFKNHSFSHLNIESDEIKLFTEEEKQGFEKGKSIYTLDQLLEILNILADTYHYNFPPISKQIHIEILLQKILSCRHAKSGQEILKHLKSLQENMRPNTFKAPAEIQQTTLSSHTPKETLNTPQTEQKTSPEIQVDLKEQVKHDTIMQFAAVELEGRLNKNTT